MMRNLRALEPFVSYANDYQGQDLVTLGILAIFDTVIPVPIAALIVIHAPLPPEPPLP